MTITSNSETTATSHVTLATTDAGHFVTPVFPYIIESGESTYEIIAEAGDVADLQLTLDSARTANPDAVIIIHIRVPLTVSDDPLTLGSEVCVSLEGNGRIKASENPTSTSLILIENAEFVSIAGVNTALACLDGNNAVAYGVRVTNSGKVNLDNLSIFDCTTNGNCTARCNAWFIDRSST